MLARMRCTVCTDSLVEVLFLSEEYKLNVEEFCLQDLFLFLGARFEIAFISLLEESNHHNLLVQ